MAKKGKFIVIDGTDGSGKQTQTELLIDRLRQSGFSVEKADFPQYGQKSAGLVEQYLNGKYGPADEVGPFRASIFYACDRYDASFKIRHWLDEGKIVVANRYVAANMGHQGGKITDYHERQDFFRWLYDLEFKVFGIPEPDLNIILHVDAAIAQSLVDAKGDRAYVGGCRRDIHEADLDHLRNAERVYKEIAGTFPGFVLIECTESGRIMARESIADLVWSEVIKQMDDYWTYSSSCGRLDIDPLPCAPNFIKPRFPVPEDRASSPRLKVQRLSPLVKIPQFDSQDTTSLDLFAADYYSIYPGEKVRAGTGIRIAVPDGFIGLIWNDRDKAGSGLYASESIIGPACRNEVKVDLINLGPDICNIIPGQKIGKITIQRSETFTLAEDQVDVPY